MEGALSKEMVALLEKSESEGQREEIPVIVTVKEGTDLHKLETLGLKISARFKLLNAVSGHITPEGARKIADLDEVEKIEYDREMRAVA